MSIATLNFEIGINIILSTDSTCGLAEELDQGKIPEKKTVTSSCGSVSYFQEFELKVFWAKSKAWFECYYMDEN